MRVATVFHLSSVGGPSRSLAGVTEWLAGTGSVTSVFPDEGEAVEQYRRLGEVVVAGHTALTNPRGAVAAAGLAGAQARDAAALARVLRRIRPDLVLVATTSIPVALAAARVARAPAVVYAAELRARAGWGAALMRGTAGAASGIVCCSRLVADQFRGARVPLAIAYPPVGAGGAPGDRDRGRARLGLDGADPGIAVVGSLSHGRGQDVAIRALPAILAEAPRARLALVGDPHPRRVDRTYAAELRRLVAELRVDAAVSFAGAVSDPADAYAAADVLVNPARVAESFGRVVPEALVAGRPAIATDVGAVREVVRDGVDALLVPPDDPAAIARAVVGLWRDAERAARLVRSGAARVEAEFGPEQDLAAWRSVIERVAAG